MPLIVLGSFILGVLIAWVILSRKYQTLLQDTLRDATKHLSDEITELESSAKESQQKIADLEYTLREKEKDIAAYKGQQR